MELESLLPDVCAGRLIDCEIATGEDDVADTVVTGLGGDGCYRLAVWW